MCSDSSCVHFMAQTLNNQGCSFVAKGDFDAAITYLKQALELTRLSMSSNNTAESESRSHCTCKYCSLEASLNIVDEEELEINDQDCKLTPSETASSSSSASCSRPPKRKRPCISTVNNERQPKPILQTDDKANPNDQGFIYRRPMLVPKQSIEGFHFMGPTLSFIVLFNIALAHHLKAIEMLPLVTDRKERISLLQHPLKLYELAYQLHFQCLEQDSNGNATTTKQTSNDQNLLNLRLMMLVTNNISQIHKLAGNENKHNQCLQHLLNALMYMNHENSCPTKNVVLAPSEKDGIFDNLSPILRTKVYAAAA